MKKSENKHCQLQIIEIYFDEDHLNEATRYDLHTLACWGAKILTFDDYRSILRHHTLLFEKVGKLS